MDGDPDPGPNQQHNGNNMNTPATSGMNSNMQNNMGNMQMMNNTGGGNGGMHDNNMITFSLDQVVHMMRMSGSAVRWAT